MFELLGWGMRDPWLAFTDPLGISILAYKVRATQSHCQASFTFSTDFVSTEFLMGLFPNKIKYEREIIHRYTSIIIAKLFPNLNYYKLY